MIKTVRGLQEIAIEQVESAILKANPTCGSIYNLSPYAQRRASEIAYDLSALYYRVQNECLNVSAEIEDEQI